MAGIVKINAVQLGDSATATQNFVWQTNVDGTAKLARGNVGATSQDILTVDAGGKVDFPQGAKTIELDTPQDTTSGTSKDFTIPAGAKRVTVLLDGVSTNGTANLMLTLNDEITGYVGCYQRGTTFVALSTAFQLTDAQAAADNLSGSISLDLLNSATNKWVANSNFGRSPLAFTCNVGGNKALAAVLTKVTVSASAGTFDVGSVNVSWEF